MLCLAFSDTSERRVAMVTQQILNLLSLPTWLSGSRSWGNGVPPEESRGKKVAKVKARMAGRPVRGELGIGLIFERDDTSAETHGPRQLHLPPKERQKVAGLEEFSDPFFFPPKRQDTKTFRSRK